jgi:aerobic-type carbon monoxide dehydrogenase small subunit (CoxS/CutS family)
MSTIHPITLTVNGKKHTSQVEARLTLADFLRENLRLTGTHLGCEHGVCGACTIIVDGAAVRSCLMFAVQAHDADIVTVEGLAVDGKLSHLQQCFKDHHALQCGFCTPGMLTTAHVFLQENRNPSRSEVVQAISGNICRCTGYIPIVNAIFDASKGPRT